MGAVTEFFDQLRLNFRLADLADILVVSFLFYLGLHWLRKRAARAVAFALFLLAVLYVCANAFNMYLTKTVFHTGLTVLLVSLVVIFQQDIRRTFEQLSSWRGFHSTKASDDWTAVINQLVETCSTLAKQKIGALIVLEGTQPLEPYIEGGVSVKGRVSMPLLLSVFHPATPGHDGAVVIDRDRVEMLGAYLPLSRNLEKIGKGGTRHAAGLGLSEACDALVIIVSEERGTISVAEHGELRQLESVAALKNRLDSFYARMYPASRDLGLTRSWRRNLTLKTLSLSMATLLWFLVAYRGVGPIQRTFEEVPIEYRNLKDMKAKSQPSIVKVNLVGSELAFDTYEPKTLRVSLDLQGYPKGEHEIVLKEKHLNLPPGIFLQQFETPIVKVQVYQDVITRDVDVEAKYEANLPKNYVVQKVDVSPKKVPLSIRLVGQPPPTKIYTEMITLTDPKVTTFTPKLELPPNAEFAGGAPPKVEVTIHLSKKKDSGKINSNNP